MYPLGPPHELSGLMTPVGVDVDTVLVLGEGRVVIEVDDVPEELGGGAELEIPPQEPKEGWHPGGLQYSLVVPHQPFLEQHGKFCGHTYPRILMILLLV